MSVLGAGREGFEETGRRGWGVEDVRRVIKVLANIIGLFLEM